MRKRPFLKGKGSFFQGKATGFFMKKAIIEAAKPVFSKKQALCLEGKVDSGILPKTMEEEAMDSGIFPKTMKERAMDSGIFPKAMKERAMDSGIFPKAMEKRANETGKAPFATDKYL